jgi:hypothetical protein
MTAHVACNVVLETLMNFVPDQADTEGSAGDHTAPTQETSGVFKCGADCDLGPLGNSPDLEWLTQLDGSMMEVNVDEVFFDQHLWPIGFGQHPR